MSTSSHHDSLGALLGRVALGDTAAFSAVYADTAPSVFGLALRVVGERGRAEDVTREAYLKIWHTAAQFGSHQGSCRSWILAIVHRVAVDHARSMPTRAVSDPDPAPAPPHGSLEATHARDALARLPRSHRQALQLAYFDGRTHDEVAGLLGLSRGTGASRIRDGLIGMRSSGGLRPR